MRWTVFFLILLLGSMVQGYTGTCNITYNGYKQLCIYDVKKAETCLNHTDSVNYSCTADYKALLREPPASVTRVTQVFTASLPNTLLVIGLSIFPISLIIWLVWKVILWLT